jgi:drug/metabolite transporter (DMT)-like permease
LLVSFTGVYIISSQGNPLQAGDVSTKGVALARGSSFFWALYFIMNLFITQLRQDYCLSFQEY